MIKKLLTVAALTLVLSSCTADKFEQIDANFALLVEENERINDAIDSNSDDITSLEEALDDAVEYLEDLVEDASEALTLTIEDLAASTSALVNDLQTVDAQLANDIETVSNNLTGALADLQAQVVTNGETINTALLTQQIVNNAQAADLLALQVALETAEGDAAANLESAIAALKVEMAIDFDEFTININTLLAGVPSQVRAKVAEALLAISWNASNVLEITVINPTDELLVLEANIAALQTELEALIALGVGGAGADGAMGIRGMAGTAGASAYDLAIDAGFVGTIAEWLESLRGADGADANDGWVQAPLGGGGDLWVFNLSNTNDYYQILNSVNRPTVFLLSFVTPGGSGVVASYASLNEAKEGARAHAIANP